MSDRPTGEGASPEPTTPVPTPAPAPAGPAAPAPVGAPVTGPATTDADADADADSDSDSDRATSPAAARSGRLSVLKRFGGFLLAILAFFLFRAFTADDGTHGIKTGECIAAVGTDDFKKVDCGDSTSLGSVTFVEKNAPTDETSALALCAKHGAQGAFTSATSDGGGGTVICVADPK